MKSSEYYAQVKDKIDALSADKALTPSMPVMHFLAIAELCVERALTYKESLVKAKFDMTKIDLLTTYIGAMRECQAAWSNVQFDTPETGKAWKVKQAEGETVSYELSKALALAFHDDENMMDKLQRVNEGGSNADKIQDLSELVYMSRANLDTLIAQTEITAEYVDKAGELATVLGSLHAKAIVDKSNLPEFRVTRDKNYTLMDEIIREVERRGQYAFRNDKTKSGYFNFSYKPVARRKKTAETTTTPVQAS